MLGLILLGVLYLETTANMVDNKGMAAGQWDALSTNRGLGLKRKPIHFSKKGVCVREYVQ